MSEISLDKTKGESFLNNINLPTLAQEDAEVLDKPLALIELRKALVGMKKGKSNGLDGIPPEFYVTFWDELGQYFLAKLHSSINRGNTKTW